MSSPQKGNTDDDVLREPPIGTRVELPEPPHDEDVVPSLHSGGGSPTPSLPPGKLLPGRTARWWQHLMFIGMGLSLGFLGGVFLTAPAFHPKEDATMFALAIADFAGLFVAISLGYGSKILCRLKFQKEKRAGYTTVRSTPHIQIRDSHGAVIPAGDRRLARSSTMARAYLVVAVACAFIAPVIWMLRFLVGLHQLGVTQ